MDRTRWDGCLQYRIYFGVVITHLEENTSDPENEYFRLVYHQRHLVYLNYSNLARQW